MSYERKQTVQCQVCGADNAIPTPYSDFKCVACGQKHYYEEGINLELTDEQKLVLREYNLAHR